MEQLIALLNEVNPILLSAFAFLVGALVGNWIAIGRDKRKEFNDVVTPIRAQLIDLRENPSPYRGLPSSAQIDILHHYMYPLRRRWLGSAMKRYKRRHEDQMRQDETGQPFYEDQDLIAKSAAEILSHLKLR